MKKSGQGISLNTIIIAAIALLVLVVLALIFTGRLNIFARESTLCTNNAGECVASENECEQFKGGTVKKGGNWNCPDPDNPVCCLAIS